MGNAVQATYNIKPFFMGAKQRGFPRSAWKWREERKKIEIINFILMYLQHRLRSHYVIVTYVVYMYNKTES